LGGEVKLIEIPIWLVLVLAGAVGQLCRSLIGLKKAIDADEYISITRVIVTTIVGMIVGGFAGALTQDWKIAFTTGYAATDGIEGMFKIASGTEKKK